MHKGLRLGRVRPTVSITGPEIQIHSRQRSLRLEAAQDIFEREGLVLKDLERIRGSTSGEPTEQTLRNEPWIASDVHGFKCQARLKSVKGRVARRE